MAPQPPPLRGVPALAAVAAVLACTLAAPAADARRLSVLQDTRLVLRIISLENCGNPENYVLFQKPVLHFRKNGGHVLDVNATVAKTIRTPHMFKLVMSRCREAVSTNTCEYFTTWSWRTGLCDMMAMQGMFWSPIVRSIHPPLACPVKEGRYTAHNATWDVDHQPLRSMLENYLWLGVFTATDQDDVTCLCARGGVQGIKVQGKA